MKKTLYISRPLLNASDLVAWARAQGFKQTLEPDDMHVTIAFSREPVEWNKVTKQSDNIEVRRGERSVQSLGDESAVVLKFACKHLEQRWAELINKCGASWDHEEYQPHVTITYGGNIPDIADIEPYTGSLLFGPEKIAEIKNNPVKEVAVKVLGTDGLAKSLFIPITKVDAEKRLVYGKLSEETPDKTGEILDYETAKPAFQEWSNTQKAASGGKSLGNVRAMHGSVAAGKLTDISYDDKNKCVEGCAKIVDDAEWQKVLEGVYTGFSIGGGYAKRWADPKDPSGTMRYTPVLAEVSIVDNPCHPAATFDVIKAGGIVECRKFVSIIQPNISEEHMLKNSGGAAGAAMQTEEYLSLIKAAEDAVKANTATDDQRELLQKYQSSLVKDGKPVKPSKAPVQFNKWQSSDGSFHDSKREAEVHELTLETFEKNSGMSALDEALLKAKKAASKREKEDEYEEDDSDDVKKEKDDRHEKKMKDKETAEKKKAADGDDGDGEGSQAKNPPVKNNEDAEPGTTTVANSAKAKKVAGNDGEQAKNPRVTNNEDAQPGTDTVANNAKNKKKTGNEDDEANKASDTGFSSDRAGAGKDPDTDASGEADSAASSNAGNTVNKAAKKAEKDDKDGKKQPYGDVEYADPGHQKDGKKRYPIDNEEHIRAAWNYVNKEKNAGQYSDEDLKSVKSKIVSAWKKKIDKDGPPSAEKNEKAFRENKAKVLAKGMYGVAQLAHKIQHIHELAECQEMEEAREGDKDSKLPDMFNAWLKQGTELLQAMVEEEISELVNDEDDDYNILMPQTVMALAAGLPKGSAEAFAKAVGDLQPFTEEELKKSYAQSVVGKLIKFKHELEKVGARTNAKDMETIGNIHAATTDLQDCMGKMMDEHMDKMHKMCKDLGFEPAEEEAESGDKKTQKMSKVLDQLQEALTKNAALEKVVTQSSETMTKAANTVDNLVSTIEKLNSRIGHLEGQPAPSKGNVRAVSKSADSMFGSNQPTKEQVDAALAKLTPEDRTMVLMKAALANPMERGAQP